MSKITKIKLIIAFLIGENFTALRNLDVFKEFIPFSKSFYNFIHCKSYE